VSLVGTVGHTEQKQPELKEEGWRERREGERGRERDRERETETETARQSERERERHRGFRPFGEGGKTRKCFN